MIPNIKIMLREDDEHRYVTASLATLDEKVQREIGRLDVCLAYEVPGLYADFCQNLQKAFDWLMSSEGFDVVGFHQTKAPERN